MKSKLLDKHPWAEVDMVVTQSGKVLKSRFLNQNEKILVVPDDPKDLKIEEILKLVQTIMRAAVLNSRENHASYLPDIWTEKAWLESMNGEKIKLELQKLADMQ